MMDRSPPVRFPSLFCVPCSPACILLATVTHPPNVAVNKQVRKSPPLTTSVETTVIIKQPKMDTVGSQGCTRVSDFDDLTKSLVHETISIYQAQIAAIQPWPSTSENWESVSQGWVEVCASRSVRIELNDEIFKVVRISFHFLLSISSSHGSYFRSLTMLRKLKGTQKQSQNLMLSWPFPLIHQPPNAQFMTRSSSSLMKLNIFIRHVYYLQVFLFQVSYNTMLE